MAKAKVCRNSRFPPLSCPALRATALRHFGLPRRTPKKGANPTRQHKSLPENDVFRQTFHAAPTCEYFEAGTRRKSSQPFAKP